MCLNNDSPKVGSGRAPAPRSAGDPPPQDPEGPRKAKPRDQTDPTIPPTPDGNAIFSARIGQKRTTVGNLKSGDQIPWSLRL